MKKIVLFLGILLLSSSFSARAMIDDSAEIQIASMVDDFVSAYEAYKEKTASIQSKIEAASIQSKNQAATYVGFSSFLLGQMRIYKFLGSEYKLNSIYKDITAAFEAYLRAVLNYQTENSLPCVIDVRAIYGEMLAGVSFCFKNPVEAAKLKISCSSGS